MQIKRCFNKILAKDNVFVKATILILFVQFIFSFYYSGRQPLWIDEIYQISFSGGTNTLFDTLMKTETTPPLFRLIANVWYHIMPYGEQYLLLLSEIFVSIAMVFAGLIGKKYFSVSVALIMEVLYGFSVAVIEKCSFEFRCYALLNCLLWIMFYIFLQRDDQKNIRGYIYQGILMVLIAYTHYFGVILCVIIGTYDLACWIRNKFSYRYIVPYIILVISYIPWIIRFKSMIKTIQPNQSWMMEPSVNNAYTIIEYLVSGSLILLLLLFAGIIYLCLNKKYANGRFIVFPLIIVELFAMLWVYGKYLQPNATLWVLRYFSILIPVIIILIGVIISQVERCFLTQENKKIFRSFVCAFLLLYIFRAVCNVAEYVSDVADGVDVANHNNFKEAADWLYTYQSEYINDKDTAIAMTTKGEAEGVFDGWYEYYIVQKGKRADINRITSDNVDEIRKYNRIYYCITPCPDENMSKILNEEYTVIDANEEYSIYVYVKNINGGEK